MNIKREEMMTMWRKKSYLYVDTFIQAEEKIKCFKYYTSVYLMKQKLDVMRVNKKNCIQYIIDVYKKKYPCLKY